MFFVFLTYLFLFFFFFFFNDTATTDIYTLSLHDALPISFGTSLAATFGLFEIDVWWEVASLITIMILGHWLEMRAISQARGALNALAALLPDTAELVKGTDIRSVPLSELRVGDIVLVRPGARVPADGTVAEGSADVDESMITRSEEHTSELQ